MSANKRFFDGKPFAEVVESSLEVFTAQSWQWDDFPAFGQLVCLESDKSILVGCVTQVRTGSIDPMRSPFPYKKTEDELRKEQPQIFEYLKTAFTVNILGYIDGAQEHNIKIFYQSARYPSKIHSFVYTASYELIALFFQKTLYLHTLFSSQLPAIDEILLALLTQLSDRKLLTQKHLDDFGMTFSLLTGNDYRRLKIFLSRVQALTQ